MLIVRGVCLVASVPVDLPNMRWPLRFRQRSLVGGRAPLYVDAGHGKMSTSFEAHLLPMGLYCGFCVEMPDGDEEANEIADYIMAGIDGCELGCDLLRKFARWEDHEPLFTDVVEYNPLSLTLTKWAPAVAYWCWVEDNGEITYDLPSEIEPLFFAVHEDIADGEPLIFDDQGQQVYLDDGDDTELWPDELELEDQPYAQDNQHDERLRGLWEDEI